MLYGRRLDEALEHVDGSRYALVHAVSKRARQITGKTAHIGALSADQFQIRVVDCCLKQIQAMHEETSQVRRLTPVECERLQGFPDNWTDGQADSARYKQMGNAVAVPVVEWIMRRLVAADEETS